MSKKAPNVYFVGGYTPRKDLMGTIAYLSELENTDEEFTRFYIYVTDKKTWMHQEIEHEIVSIAYQKIRGKFKWYLLSKRGIVVEGTSSGLSETKIKGAGTGPGLYGYVSHIKEISGELYVCGMCRQVYKKSKQTWISISSDILDSVDSVKSCFEGIDGTSAKNIYAVGWGGEIFHFDGRKWSKCDSPTNIDLNAIRCVEEDTVYICGSDGVFLRGSKNSWDVIQDEDIVEDFWGIEVYKGTPYIASRNEIFKFDGTNLVQIDTKLKPAPDSGTLHANNKILWSFGNNDLTFYDGKRWKRVICPDNR
jgi:hypothetical protein